VPCAKAYSDVSIGRRRLAQVTCGALPVGEKNPAEDSFSSVIVDMSSIACICFTSDGDKSPLPLCAGCAALNYPKI
jgi:hypothetical protein